MNYNIFKRADKKGYIIIPRRLMELLFDYKDTAKQTKVAIYVYLLTKAKYTDPDEGKDTPTRGELVVSASELSKRFGHNWRFIDRFLQHLQDEGVIGLTSQGRNRSPLVRLAYYDNLCRFTDRTPGGRIRTKKADLDFICFWDQYHAMTGLPEVEIEEARAQWNRLTARERKLATDNIAAYCCMQTTDRLRTAANYLSHKSFVMI